MGHDLPPRRTATLSRPWTAPPPAHPAGRSTPRQALVPTLVPALVPALVASLAVVALLTLTPEGTGWAWGSPLVEARWYLTGLDSTATLLQLVGNLALLAVPAALAVLHRPALATPGRLTALGLAAGTGIELLQRVLPLGRVVSPVDALLNASGAVAVGLVVDHLSAIRPPAA